MSGENFSDVSCLVGLYDDLQFSVVAGVRSVVAIFSLACSAIVISLICCCKKYQVASQKLIFGLAIISALHSVVFAIIRTTSQVQDVSCSVLGFAELYSSWVELMLISCTMGHLLLLVVYGRELSYLIHMVISFLTPLLWCWIPFINLSYGSVGPWCGIRIHISDEDCGLYLMGVVFRFMLWQVPLYTVSLVFFLVCFFLIFKKLRRDSIKWEGAHYDPEAEKAKTEVISQLVPLLFYPMIFLVLKLPLLINQIYEVVRPEEPQLVLWLLDALTSPLGGAVIALVYTCDTSSLSKVRRCCQHCLCCYLSLSQEEGFQRSRSTGSQVADYGNRLDATFGDSMDAQRARVAMQRAKIEERLAMGSRNGAYRSSSKEENVEVNVTPASRASESNESHQSLEELTESSQNNPFMQNNPSTQVGNVGEEDTRSSSSRHDQGDGDCHSPLPEGHESH